jgi:hypothetical protein
MISALFIARDSVYKTLPDVDCWDVDRDALNWPGGNPGVFHPPCRLWSMLAHFSKAPESEKELAIWSVGQVRKWGGVLEHPAHSKLWKAAELPPPGRKDLFGFTVSLPQQWFGHRAEKPTWLYICKVEPKQIPPNTDRIGRRSIFAVGPRTTHIPSQGPGERRNASSVRQMAHSDSQARATRNDLRLTCPAAPNP